MGLCLQYEIHVDQRDTKYVLLGTVFFILKYHHLSERAGEFFSALAHSVANLCGIKCFWEASGMGTCL